MQELVKQSPCHLLGCSELTENIFKTYNACQLVNASSSRVLKGPDIVFDLCSLMARLNL